MITQSQQPTIKSPTKYHRRGVTYILTLGTTLLVAGLSLSALYLIRVQHFKVDSQRDIMSAREYTIAWNRFCALLQVKTNTNWRSNVNTGNWSADRVISGGTYNFTGSDPFDSDLTKQHL